MGLPGKSKVDVVMEMNLMEDDRIALLKRLCEGLTVGQVGEAVAASFPGYEDRVALVTLLED